MSSQSGEPQIQASTLPQIMDQPPQIGAAQSNGQVSQSGDMQDTDQINQSRAIMVQWVAPR